MLDYGLRVADSLGNSGQIDSNKRICHRLRGCERSAGYSN
jgi:hypothetical protein